MILNNASDVQAGSASVNYVYAGSSLVWSRGSPPTPPSPTILQDAINVILLDTGDVRTNTINYFYTIEDLRTFMLANGYPKRYEVIFGDDCFDALAKHYEPGTYVTNPELAYTIFEESYMDHPFDTNANSRGVNNNIVFLTLGDGFRKIYYRGTSSSYTPKNVITMGTCTFLRELRLPSTLTLIDDPEYAYDGSTRYKNKWGGTIEKVYIDQQRGSISGEAWGITSEYNSPNAQIIWTG